MSKPPSPRRSGSAPQLPPRRRWPGRVLRGVAVAVISIEAVWFGIHSIPGVGPALADGARAVLGPGSVAWAEDVAYDLADRLNIVRYRHAAPTTFWESPPPAPQAPAETVATGSTSATPAPRNAAPAPYAPPFPEVAAANDGSWVAIADDVAPSDAPVLWKSVVHPDPKRGYAAIAVVAIDLARVDLRLIAGTKEPFSTDVPAARRPGLIPTDHAAELIAAFNGGFKAVHGHYGMMLDGDTFLAPRDIACTVALYRDGAVRVRTWTALRGDEQHMTAYRQTPPCLVEEGQLNGALYDSNRSWGATVSGETVIRRSALGVDETGKRLFYGIGEAVTARSLARGMKAAGAHDVAELDVNQSYPRFLLYGHKTAGAPPRAGSALIPDVQFKATEYVGDPSQRDFFYLLRRRSTS